MTTLLQIPELYIISPRERNQKNGSFLTLSRDHIIPSTKPGIKDIAKNFDDYLYGNQ